ncbi:MAG: hypothetical protein DRJ05_12840 [Bacteroidetes bacterium]|nr:MAG: hypothetical protein DRJ05_12840 [Bacteroidota bacterium]
MTKQEQKENRFIKSKPDFFLCSKINILMLNEFAKTNSFRSEYTVKINPLKFTNLISVNIT